MNKVVASGLDYSKAAEVIEKIAEVKARKYKKISYLDPEDIKQEIRIKCWSLLEKQDDTRMTEGGLFNFFGSACDNMLKDLHRKLVYNPINSEIYSQSKFFSTIVLEFGVYKMIGGNGQNKQFSVSEYIDQIDLIEYIENILPEKVIGLYNRLKENGFDCQCLKSKERHLLCKEMEKAIERFRRI